MPGVITPGSDQAPNTTGSVQYYADAIGRKQGAKYKAAYLQFVQGKLSKYSPYQLAILFEAQVAAKGLGSVIGKVGNLVGNQVPNAAAKAAENTIGQNNSSACLISLPKIGPVSLGGCIFTKTEARALIGGVVMAGAVVIGITAGVLLVSYGLTGTKTGQAATRSAMKIGSVYSKVPGLGTAGRRIANANR